MPQDYSDLVADLVDDEEAGTGGFPIRGTITSRPGPSRDGGRRKHAGTDIAAPGGTPIPWDWDDEGEVVFAGKKGGYGNLVEIRARGKKRRYAHLEGFDVKAGDRVAKGQVFGRVGNTGKVQGKNGGYHLHYEEHDDDTPATPRVSYDDLVADLNDDVRPVDSQTGTPVPIDGQQEPSAPASSGPVFDDLVSDLVDPAAPDQTQAAPVAPQKFARQTRKSRQRTTKKIKQRDMIGEFGRYGAAFVDALTGNRQPSQAELARQQVTSRGGSLGRSGLMASSHGADAFASRTNRAASLLAPAHGGRQTMPEPVPSRSTTSGARPEQTLADLQAHQEDVAERYYSDTYNRRTGERLPRYRNLDEFYANNPDLAPAGYFRGPLAQKEEAGIGEQYAATLSEANRNIGDNPVLGPVARFVSGSPQYNTDPSLDVATNLWNRTAPDEGGLGEYVKQGARDLLFPLGVLGRGLLAGGDTAEAARRELERQGISKDEALGAFNLMFPEVGPVIVDAVAAHGVDAINAAGSELGFRRERPAAIYRPGGIGTQIGAAIGQTPYVVGLSALGIPAPLVLGGLEAVSGAPVGFEGVESDEDRGARISGAAVMGGLMSPIGRLIPAKPYAAFGDALEKRLPGLQALQLGERLHGATALGLAGYPTALAMGQELPTWQESIRNAIVGAGIGPAAGRVADMQAARRGEVAAEQARVAQQQTVAEYRRMIADPEAFKDELEAKSRAAETLRRVAAGEHLTADPAEAQRLVAEAESARVQFPELAEMDAPALGLEARNLRDRMTSVDEALLRPTVATQHREAVEARAAELERAHQTAQEAVTQADVTVRTADETVVAAESTLGQARMRVQQASAQVENLKNLIAAKTARGEEVTTQDVVAAEAQVNGLQAARRAEVAAAQAHATAIDAAKAARAESDRLAPIAKEAERAAADAPKLRERANQVVEAARKAVEARREQERATIEDPEQRAALEAQVAVQLKYFRDDIGDGERAALARGVIDAAHELGRLDGVDVESTLEQRIKAATEALDVGDQLGRTSDARTVLNDIVDLVARGELLDPVDRRALHDWMAQLPKGTRRQAMLDAFERAIREGRTGDEPAPIDGAFNRLVSIARTLYDPMFRNGGVDPTELPADVRELFEDLVGPDVVAGAERGVVDVDIVADDNADNVEPETAVTHADAEVVGDNAGKGDGDNLTWDGQERRASTAQPQSKPKPYRDMTPEERETAFYTDDLTGVFNQRKFLEIAEAAGLDPSTALAAFDANNFGWVNKALSQGHGDEALRDVAYALMRASERVGIKHGQERVPGVVDGVYRSGIGDEFHIVGPKELVEQAKKLAEEEFGKRSVTGRDPLTGFTYSKDVSISGSVGETRESAEASLQDAKIAAKEDPDKAVLVSAAPIEQIEFDPDRFQYKGGADEQGGTESLLGADYNEDLVGVLTVWRDPVNGRFYVINGHNRRQKAAAAGAKTLPVKIIPARVTTAAEARAWGAMENISEGKGTAIDAATFFRDGGYSIEEARREIPITQQVGRDGIELTKLGDDVFKRVVDGTIDIPTGVAIAKKLTDPDLQMQAMNLVLEQKARGRVLDRAHLAEVVDSIASAPVAEQVTLTLFGDQVEQRALVVERGGVAAYIKAQIAADKRAFGAAARNKDRLERGGNTIDADASKSIAESARNALGVFDRLKNRSGPIAEVLDDAARQIADGQPATSVRSDAYQKLRPLLDEALTGTTPERVARGEADEGARGEVSERDAPAAEEPRDVKNALARASEKLRTVADALRADPDQAEADAIARLKAGKGKKLPGGPEAGDIGPIIGDLTDLLTIATAKMKRGAADFADWSADFLDTLSMHFGADYAEQVRPHVQEIYDQARASLAEDVPSPTNESDLPPMRPLPETGQYAAVRTDDGSIYYDDNTSSARTHRNLIDDLKIPHERLVDGGWVSDGVYEGSARSDTARLAEVARAKARVEERRAARGGDQTPPVYETPTSGPVPPDVSTNPANVDTTPAPKTPPAAPAKPPKVKRKWKAGLNDGEVVFASEPHRDLFDIGAELRRSMSRPGKTKDRQPRDIEPMIDALAKKLKVSPEKVRVMALGVAADVRAQMKGVKDGETRHVTDSFGADDIEETLRKRLEDVVGVAELPIPGAGVTMTVGGGEARTGEPGGGKTAPDVRFAPEQEQAYQASKNLEPRQSVMDRVKEIATTAYHKATRPFEHLTRGAKHAEFFEDLKELEVRKGVASDKAILNVKGLLAGFDRTQYDLFNRKVVLDDLAEELGRRQARNKGSNPAARKDLEAEVARITTRVEGIKQTLDIARGVRDNAEKGVEATKAVVAAKKALDQARAERDEILGRLRETANAEVREKRAAFEALRERARGRGLDDPSPDMVEVGYPEASSDLTDAIAAAQSDYEAARERARDLTSPDLERVRGTVKRHSDALNAAREAARTDNRAAVEEARVSYAEAKRALKDAQKKLDESAVDPASTDLAFNFNPATLAEARQRVDAAVAADPRVAEAIGLRKALWRKVTDDYLNSAREAIGFEPPMNRQNYFRNIILDGLDAKRSERVFKDAIGFHATTNDPFTKKREATNRNYLSDYVRAEHEALSLMLQRTREFEILRDIERRYNVGEELRKTHHDTWRDHIPEGYIAWQPKPGRQFYEALTVPEKYMAELLLSGADPHAAIPVEELQKVLAAGRKHHEWVVPAEIAATLDSIEADPEVSVVRKSVRLWKKFMLMGPHRFIKYNVRNVSGDADGLLAANPTAAKEIPAAAKDLYNFLYRQGAPSPELKSYVERGGMQDLFRGAELGADVAGLKQFRQFYDKKTLGQYADPREWMRAYNDTVGGASDAREALLRYALFRQYRKEMLADPEGRPKSFGASLPDEVMAIADVDRRAHKMSNDAIGAYNELTVMGKYLRDTAWPFWSWNEVNIKRYKRLIQNSFRDEKTVAAFGEAAMKGAGVLVRRSPAIALRVGKVAAQMSILSAGLAAYNALRFPEEEADLPADVRKRPHIVLGRDSDGNVIYFDRMGAIGDALEWFGKYDDQAQVVKDYMDGKSSWYQAIGSAAKNAGYEATNKLVQGLGPSKTIAEVAFGEQMYPDISRPRPIRDRAGFLIEGMGFGPEYRAARGLPNRGAGRLLQDQFAYEIDPEEAAYGDIRSLATKFDEGLNGPKQKVSREPSDKSNALYYWKQAKRYGDKEAAERFELEFMSLTVGRELASKQDLTATEIKLVNKAIKSSLEAAEPLYGLDPEERAEFIGTLKPRDRVQLDKAQTFWNEVMVGDERQYLDTDKLDMDPYGLMPKRGRDADGPAQLSPAARDVYSKADPVVRAAVDFDLSPPTSRQRKGETTTTYSARAARTKEVWREAVRTYASQYLELPAEQRLAKQKEYAKRVSEYVEARIKAEFPSAPSAARR